MENKSVAEDKIITKRVTTMDELFDECLNQYFEFYESILKNVNNNNNNDRCNNLYNNLSNKLNLWHVRTQLSNEYENTLINDIKIYENKLKELKQQQIDIKYDIKKLEIELKNHELLRSNKQTYDDLLKIINKHPSRQESTKQLNLMKTKLKNIQHYISLCDNEINKRTKQCYYLMSSIQTLKREFGNKSHFLSNINENNFDNINEI